MVAFLEALVLAESPSVVPESQCPVQSLLARSLRDDGFRVRIIKGHGKSGGLLLAAPRQRSRSSPFQLLLGHTDTVWPLGTLARMPIELENETLKGPGVYDMKGGLVQLVFALRSLGPGGRATGHSSRTLQFGRGNRQRGVLFADPPVCTPCQPLLRIRTGPGPLRQAEDGPQGCRSVHDPDRGPQRACRARSPRPARARFSSFPT